MVNKSSEISQFITITVAQHPSDIVLLVAERFGISRQNAHKHVIKEVENKTLIKVGQTNSTRYYLADGNHIEFSIKIKSRAGEDVVWIRYVKPMLKKLPSNLYEICNYSFAEIFNNAIDHSKGTVIHTSIDITDKNIIMRIEDDGVGIFEKIKKALNLETSREALLHLSKGKFTTDPKNHTGQGIFFSSRMCDSFSLASGDMHYLFAHNEWLLSDENKKDIKKGTSVIMSVSLDSKKTPKEIFDKYANEELGFHKSVVAVALSNDPNDPHVSRSQAKRLLMGLDKFKTIMLDFKNVSSVGQAFVDEVFRVYQNEHPDIKIHWVGANPEVESMIKSGLANK